MAASNSPARIVEHIVLFKVKEGASPQQCEAMVAGLRSLKSIDTVIELSAGPALLQPSSSPSSSYSHALHCRYRSKEDLAAYASHPFHLEVIRECIAPIVDDRLAVDWEADLEDPVPQGGYDAVRVMVFKPREDLPHEELCSMVDTLKNYKERFPSIKQTSVGKNFSPERAKGFEWGFLSLFPTAQDLQELTKSEEEGADLQRSKLQPALQDFIVLDYSTTLSIGAYIE